MKQVCKARLYCPYCAYQEKDGYNKCGLTLDELKVVQEQSESKHKVIYSKEKRERESAKIYVTIANEIRPKSIQMKEDIS